MPDHILRNFFLIALVLLLSACGGGGSNNTQQQPPPTNSNPTSAATSSVSAAYSTETVQLDGSGSSDSDGQINSYAWTQTAGPAVSITNADQSMAEFVVPRLENAAEIKVQLQVADDDGAIGTSEVAIQVTPAPVQFAVDISGTQPFVDSDPVTLLVTAATLNGSNISPSSLEWESDIQGSLAISVSISQSITVALDYGDHVLTQLETLETSES